MRDAFQRAYEELEELIGEADVKGKGERDIHQGTYQLACGAGSRDAVFVGRAK